MAGSRMDIGFQAFYKVFEFGINIWMANSAKRRWRLGAALVAGTAIS
jgi:hypothetical protein